MCGPGRPGWAAWWRRRRPTFDVQYRGARPMPRRSPSGRGSCGRFATPTSWMIWQR